MRTWIRSLFRRRQPRVAPQPRAPRLTLERLEDRTVPSTMAFLQTNLVSDLPNVAAITDPHLVNPWGISEGPTGGPFWISDNNAGVSTLYSVPGAMNTQVSMNGLVVSIPTPGDLFGASGTPTGTVNNIDGGKLGGFMLTGVDKNGKATSAPAAFLFVTEDGTIVGWNPGVNPQGFDPTNPQGKAGTFGILAVDNSGNNFTNPNPDQQTGAVYKGLAIATSSTQIFNDPNSTGVIYATNFRSGQIEVYDNTFGRVTPPMGAFTDTSLPKGYAPFNVQVLNGKVYVTYALQDDTKHDDVAGHGHGFVDVFNLDGTPGLANGQERLISRGALDSPWGLAIAPSSFGQFAGDLLVGNFGNGFINVYDPTNPNVFLGQLKDPDGEPIQIDGLWALKVGNGNGGGAADTVYFTAGLFGESHGLFGSLSAVTPGSAEGQAEAQAVTAALDVFQLALNQVQQDLSSGVTGSQLRQDIHALHTARNDLLRAELRFLTDAVHDAGGHTHDWTDDLEDALSFVKGHGG
jgi:uncharacterized protein (TIGR03118 family)